MTGPLGLFGIVAVVLSIGVADALPPKKIVGGTKASPGEFPYMISLRGDLLGGHYCGGAIVGPRHIVTAASCIEALEPEWYFEDQVVTGSVFINSGTNHSISNVICHPDYDPASNETVHDIGIIVLAEDIVFDENQTSVDLPTGLVPEGVFANMTGWGYTDFYAGDITPELMKINVKTVGTDACRNSYAGETTIRSSHLCAFGGSGVGACGLDFGDPLVYNGQLIGVFSYGMPCARGYPDVFTNVYHYLDWIRNTIKE